MTTEKLTTIKNMRPQMSMTVEHIVLLPELCPASKNPKQGSTLTISYDAGEVLLELFQLDRYIQAYIGNPIVRDMEYFTQVIAQDVANILNCRVNVLAELDYNRLSQRQRIKVSANPQEAES